MKLSDAVAGRGARRAPQREQLADLVQREAERLSATNERDDATSFVVVVSLTRTSSRLSQQTAALVVANRLDVHAGFAGEQSDGPWSVHVGSVAP